MNILNLIIIISLLLILVLFILMITFYFRKNIILKMVDLCYIYMITIVFLMYFIVIKNSEDILFPIFIIIFIDLLLTFLTGIVILHNMLKNEGM